MTEIMNVKMDFTYIEYCISIINCTIDYLIHLSKERCGASRNDLKGKKGEVKES